MGALKQNLIECEGIFEECKSSPKGFYYDTEKKVFYWTSKNPITGDIIVLEYNYEPQNNVETTEIFGYIPQWYAKEVGLV